MRAAQVINGVVAGVYIVDTLDISFLLGLVESETANVGDIYDPETGIFTPPPELPPDDIDQE